MARINKRVFGAEVSQDIIDELKKIGGVKPPREFVFMDRAAIGLGSVFLHLDAELNWYKIFNELIDDFTVKQMKQHQKQALKVAKLEENY